MAPTLPPLKHFIGQLDLSDYDSRGEILKAARALRDQEKRRIAVLKKDEDDFKRRQLTMAEKRAFVSQGTHKWCWKCRGKGYLRGRDRVMLPCHPCARDGLIKVKHRGKRGPSRPARPMAPTTPRRRRRGGRGRSSGPTRRPRARGRRRIARKVATNAAGMGAFYLGAGELLGTIGYVLAAVVLVVLVAAKVAAMLLHGVAWATGGSS